MKHPAMSLVQEDEQLFLKIGEKRVLLRVPYVAEVTRASLAAEGIDTGAIDAAIGFLDRIRDHFQRPDLYAAA